MDTDQYLRVTTKELMRWLSARAVAAGKGYDPQEIYQSRWGETTGNSSASLVMSACQWAEKAATSPAMTSDPAWAGDLVASRLSTGFLTAVRRASVIGQLDVPRVPFQTQMTTLTAGSSTVWVAEGLSKPISTMGFANTPALTPTKASSIVVITRELAEFAAEGSEEALQRVLQNEVIGFTDAAFLGTAAATASSPAGLLNGVTASADLGATISAFFNGRPNAGAPVWIASPAKLSAFVGADNHEASHYAGFPIVRNAAAGPHAILMDPVAVAVADGGLVLDVSRNALIQMDSVPTSPPVETSVFTSLWQANLSAIRCERTINWTKDANAVAYTVLS